MSAAPGENVFEELKRYVGFVKADEELLRALGPVAEPHFPRVSEVFYQRILEHDGARTALVGGESQVGHLKVTLVTWMQQLCTGPWDEAYYERRARIGRMHVQISLPQHYMFGAMNVLRRELNALVDVLPEAARAPTRTALDRLLDLELAIMLHTYREDLLSAQSRAERLATFGQLVGSIGHELRNPLGVIETSLYLLKSRVTEDPKVSKHLERIGDQVKLANNIITQLLEMIRERPLQRGPVDLATVIHSAIDGVSRPSGVSVTATGLEGLPGIQGDATQLRQLLLNLVENAVHAVGDVGAIRIEASSEAAKVRVTVTDDGPGIDPTIRARLFEPLVTTKARGIGLGLALVRRIARRHEGTITVEAAPGHGARFILTLPREA